MSTSDLQAREELIEALGVAVEAMAGALALIGEAYEHLDEIHADRFEQEAFKPLQRGYALAKRARTEYALRNSLAAEERAIPIQPAPGSSVRSLVDGTLEAIADAEAELVALQDSMMLVEIGDASLREALGRVRGELESASKGARNLLRTFGR